MVSFKRLLLLLITIVAIASCKNGSNSIEQPPSDFKKPVVESLIFSKPKKIDWNALKTIGAKPAIKKLNFNNLPSEPYDTTALKPFKSPVLETTFDYDAIPQKDFDIEKFPSKPLKFKTYLLPPPKLIKAGSQQLKNVELSLFSLGEAQGLSGPIASCTFESKEGFIWVATDQGLFRYDGENILQFIAGPVDDYIIEIMDDGQGSLWLGTLNGGLEIFNVKSGTLKKAEQPAGFISHAVTRIIKDEQQRTWVTSEQGGLAVIDPKKQTVKTIGKAEGLADTINYAVQDKRHNILMATSHGLFVVDTKNKKVKNIGKAQGLKSDFLYTVFIDRDSAIWLADNNLGLNILDVKKQTNSYIKEIDIKHTSLAGISQDNKGRIWVSVFNYGEYIIDPEKRLIRSLKFTDGLSGDGVMTK